MGAISSIIRLRFEYQNTELKTTAAERPYTFARASKLDRWNYICIDIHALVSGDSWVQQRISSKPNLKLDFIRVFRDGSGSDYVLLDDVWIGSTDISGTLLIPWRRSF